MLVTYYRRPTGTPSQIDMTNVLPDDERWFTENNVKVSLEGDGESGVILYGDVGLVSPDGDPEEAILLSQGRTCVECMHELRKLCEELISTKKETT